jgi:hypothetical protein
MTPQKATYRLTAKILGACLLASGAALVTHILSGISLLLALVLGIGLVGLLIRALWRRVNPAERYRLKGTVKAGLLAGGLATVSYDAAKFVLSQWDPSLYNPFEVIRVFGILLTDPSAPTVVIYSAGVAFHLLNGISFGIAFCLLLRRYSVGTGVAWGLFLELFQLTLYPGWLDIRFYQEFAQISALSHVVYGAVLGLASQSFLQSHAKGKGMP